MEEANTIQGRGRRRRILIVLAVCVLVGICVVALWPREREPSYNGKKLSEWLREYRKPLGAMAPTISQEAADAVGHIGTNAIPFLVRWIRDDEDLPEWKTKLVHVVYRWNSQSARNRTLEIIAQRQVLAYRAGWGFEILGQSASAAIPELTRMARAGNGRSASDAFAALSSVVGKDSIPQLLAFANDRNYKWRIEAISALAGAGKLGTDPHTVVVSLIEYLKEPDPKIVYTTANVLGWLKLESDITVPALGELLQSADPGIRERGLANLGDFGDRARPVLSQVLAALQDSSGEVRRSATNALLKIAPETLTNGVSGNF